MNTYYLYVLQEKLQARLQPISDDTKLESYIWLNNDFLNESYELERHYHAVNASEFGRFKFATSFEEYCELMMEVENNEK